MARRYISKGMQRKNGKLTDSSILQNVGNKRKYSEKQKRRSSTFFETYEVKFFLGNSVTKIFFRAECLKVRTSTNLFCYKKIR